MSNHIRAAEIKGITLPTPQPTATPYGDTENDITQ